MKKLALIILASAAVAVFSMSTPQFADAGKDCARTKFQTSLIERACKRGGQKAAKKAMRHFVKVAKKSTREKITCKTCHSKVSGNYPLKKDGLENFKRFKKVLWANYRLQHSKTDHQASR